MIDASPLALILIGFVLVVIGFALPFLMVLGILPSGFLLSVISYFASMGGLILGVFGAASYMRERRK